MSACRTELDPNGRRPFPNTKTVIRCSYLNVQQGVPLHPELGRTAPSIPADPGFDAVDTNRNMVAERGLQQGRAIRSADKVAGTRRSRLGVFNGEEGRVVVVGRDEQTPAIPSDFQWPLTRVLRLAERFGGGLRTRVAGVRVSIRLGLRRWPKVR